MSTKPDTSEAVELKPCPFDGCEVKIKVAHTGLFHVWCPGCHVDIGGDKDRQAVIDFWNTRSASPSPAVEVLVEALKEWERLNNLKGLDPSLRKKMKRRAANLTSAALSAYEGKGEK